MNPNTDKPRDVMPGSESVPVMAGGDNTAEAQATLSRLDDTEQQLWDDYEWCLHDDWMRQTYGGKVVAVNQRKVWGAGKNHQLALSAALQEANCPSRERLAIVFVPELL